MARKNDPFRGGRFDPRTMANDPAIEQILRDMGISIQRPETRERTADQLLNDWQESVGAMCESHSRSIQRQGERLKGTAELKSVNPTKGCEAVLRCGMTTYRATWEVDFDQHTIRAFCTCGHRDLCEHTYFFAMQLMGWLTISNSDLVAKIRGEKPGEHQFRQTVSMLQALTRNAQQVQRPQPESTAVELPPLTRFIWDLYYDDRHHSTLLRPYMQQEKKNGGWTKGKCGDLESFMETSRDGWSAIDHQIAGKIVHERWHGPELELSDALKVLAGSDQFTFNREASDLSTQTFEVVVREVEGGLELSTSPGDLALQLSASNPLVIDAGKGILVVMPTLHRGVFFPAPPDGFAICRQLLKQRDVIPTEQRDLLLKELLPLQSCLSVRLPESLAGKEIEYDAQPVLLMQLRRNGMLDAGIQMRDRVQMLQTPGEGLLRIPETVDGQPVQYLRRMAEETCRAGELATELRLKRGLSLSRWAWRFQDADDISELLTSVGAFVERGELIVVWHKDSVSRFDVIGRLTANNVRVEVSKQRDWFGLNGTCRIGDQVIPLKDLLTGMHGRPMNGLLEIMPGKWAAVAEELRSALRRLSDVSHETRGKLLMDASAAPIMSALAAAQVQVDSDRHWDKCLKRLRDATVSVSDPPAGLNAQLRDYQLEGFRWLCRLSHWGIGGILADDMGLGKTVQALALLLTRVETGPALVIAPTSLGFNWQRECERFTPSLAPILFRETDRGELKDRVGDGDVVICSYGLALREAERLKEIPWGTMILDEAQNIKNSNSKTAAQIRTIPAEWKVALTGTPMENHLGELWSIFHTVAPGVLGSWEQFRRRFAAPIEKENNSERREALSRVIAPFILRRSKSEVLKDLPARSEMNLLVDLSPEERQRYNQMRLSAVSDLDQIGDDNLSHDQRFKVLQMLTRLRQLSCHIGLVDDTWKGSSSKLEVLMEQLEQLKERGNRPLIFSQFVSHLTLIREACDKAGITYQYLDGQTTPPQRQERVEAFQAGQGDAFLISLKAGGTGLNLTAADYVIHMDPWWNPAVEDQATDRAHRIGQTRPVMVYRIIARGTIEEQILKMHDDKRDLVDGVLSGADAAAKLSTQELAAMIREGIEVPGVT